MFSTAADCMQSEALLYSAPKYRYTNIKTITIAMRYQVAEVVSLATGVPLGSLLSSESKRLLHMEQALSARVVGQDEAIKSVSQCVRLARAGIHTH
jgi:ATP-dependent Clp protease ATP-binding subunit ClpA